MKPKKVQQAIREGDHQALSRMGHTGGKNRAAKQRKLRDQLDIFERDHADRRAQEEHDRVATANEHITPVDDSEVGRQHVDPNELPDA